MEERPREEGGKAINEKPKPGYRWTASSRHSRTTSLNLKKPSEVEPNGTGCSEMWPGDELGAAAGGGGRVGGIPERLRSALPGMFCLHE